MATGNLQLSLNINANLNNTNAQINSVTNATNSLAQSTQTASNAAGNLGQSTQTASNAAGNLAQSAQTASNAAGNLGQSAQTASNAAGNLGQSAQTASNAAGNLAQNVNQLSAASSQLSHTINNTNITINQMGAATQTVGSYLSRFNGLLGGLSFTYLASGILKTNIEFQSLRTSLDSAVGGVANANIAFQAIQKFASTTQYSVAEVTESFIKLKNLGLSPSERALMAYANTAGAMGKSLNQMIEAVADAATGEFERLKEFGIKSSKQGDDVTFTFKGVSTTIKNDSQAIQDYLLKIGEVDFAGGAVKKSQTMRGVISNLGDNWQAFQDHILDSSAENRIGKWIASAASQLQSLDSWLNGASTTQGKIAELQQKISFSQRKVAANRANGFFGGLIDDIAGFDANVELNRQDAMTKQLAKLQSQLKSDAVAFTEMTKAADTTGNTFQKLSATVADSAGKLKTDEMIRLNHAKALQNIADMQTKGAADAAAKLKQLSDKGDTAGMESAKNSLIEFNANIKRLRDAENQDYQKYLDSQAKAQDKQLKQLQQHNKVTADELKLAHAAIMKIESGGNLSAVNKNSGALGAMQVLPSTLKDPGYGMRPFAPAVAEGVSSKWGYDRLKDFAGRYGKELKEFGEKYIDALVKHYGSLDKAVQAYGDHTAGYMQKFKTYMGQQVGLTQLVEETDDKIKQSAEQTKAAAQIIEQVRSPQQVFADNVAHAAELMDASKISLLDYTQAYSVYQQKLEQDTGVTAQNQAVEQRLSQLREERLQLEMTAQEWAVYQNSKITNDPTKREQLDRLTLANFADQKQKKQLEYKVSYDDKALQDGLTRANQLAQNLKDSFGSVGEAIGGMIQALANYDKTANDIETQRRAVTEENGATILQIADAQIKAANQLQVAELDKYANMTNAAKSFFKQGTAGYKAMDAASKAFRIYEMALSAQSMAQNIANTASQVVAWVTGETTKTTATVATVAPAIAASEVKGMAYASEAVAAQATIPVAGFAMAAAMAALMLGLGFAVSGGGGDVNIAENRQKTQGAGTVLGDSSAKSESISKSLELLKSNSDIMLPLTNQMTSSLRNIENNIGIISVQQSRGLNNVTLPGGVKTGTVYDNNYAKAAGGIGLISSGIGLAGGVGAIGAALGLGGTIASGGALTAAGLAPGAGALLGGAGLVVGLLGMAVPAIGQFINKILGFSTKVISLDNGIEVAKQSVGQVATSGIDARAYEDVQIKKKAFFITVSNKMKTYYGELDNATTGAMTNIIMSMRDTLGLMTSVFDVTTGDFLNNINNFVIDIGRISLKGMTGEQINKALSDVFSKLGDQMAAAAFPFITDFQKTGEGLFQTLTRVATDIEQANVYLEIAGIKAIKYSEIINKQGDVFAEIARQSIIAQETAAKGIADIISTMDGAGKDIIDTYQKLSAIRDSLNLTGLSGNNLSRFSILGAGGLSELESAVSAYTDKYFSDAEKLNMALTKTSGNFVKLGLAMPSTTSEFRALVESIDTSTESGQKLQGQVLALADSFAATADMAAKTVETMQSNLSTAESDLRQAYDRESGIFKQAIDDFGNFAKSLKEYLDSLVLSDLSTKTPLQKYEEARRQFDEVNALIASSDMAKQKEGLGRLQGVSQTFLQSSRGFNASSAGYVSDFATVTAALNSSIAKATTTQDINQLQLNALTDQVGKLITLNESVLSVKQAIDALTIAQVGLQNAQNAMAKAAQDSIAAAKAEAERQNQQRFADLESKRLSDYEANLRATAQAQYPLNTVAPNTYIAGQSGNALWEQVLSQFNAGHRAKFGIDMNREWNADEDAKKAKAVLDEQYKALATNQNATDVQNAIAVMKAQNPFVAQTYDPLKRYALGGISHEPAIFGEAGSEAAVPLPDGRTIPVTFTNNNNNADLIAEIKKLRQEVAELKAESKKQTELKELNLKVDQVGYKTLIEKSGQQADELENINKRERLKA